MMLIAAVFCYLFSLKKINKCIYILCFGSSQRCNSKG